MHTVIDAGKQHRLVPQWDSGARHAVTGLCKLEGDLIRVVDMDVQPQGMETTEHLAQLACDPHGQENGDAGANANNLDVRNLAQAGQDLFQDLGRQHQRIATGKEHVPHLRCPPQVLKLHVELFAAEGLPWITHDARTGTVAAVRGALGRDKHQNAVGVTVHQSRDRGVAVFGQ